MRIGLVTTTINVPHVLRLYRKAGPEVRFFVALDQKSPLEAIQRLASTENWVCDNIQWLRIEDQEQWKCSDLIGWNTIARRNIATLEALKWGAEIVVFVDDDNIPVNPSTYFGDYRVRLGETLHFLYEFDGLLASPEHDWFDVGQLYDPPASHRGFPHQVKPATRFSFVTDAKIGVHAGLVIGDPDVSALTRIARAPIVHRFSEVLRNGVVVDPRFTHTVFNTQNSAVIRELAPAMLLCPQFGRYDDIIASLVTQRCMVSTGHYVLHGLPVVYHERHVHDLTKDLADEAWGQAHLLEVVDAIDRIELGDQPITTWVRHLYGELDKLMPGVDELARAWISDCEKAMR